MVLSHSGPNFPISTLSEHSCRLENFGFLKVRQKLKNCNVWQQEFRQLLTFQHLSRRNCELPMTLRVPSNLVTQSRHTHRQPNNPTTPSAPNVEHN